MPQLVANPIHHRLAQVRLQRSGAAEIDVLDPSERPKQGLLDNVVGVCKIAGPDRKAAASPSAEWGKVPGEETFDCTGVAETRPIDQFQRGHQVRA
jgi:hypothetical protein